MSEGRKAFAGLSGLSGHSYPKIELCGIDISHASSVCSLDGWSHAINVSFHTRSIVVQARSAPVHGTRPASGPACLALRPLTDRHTLDISLPGGPSVEDYLPCHIGFCPGWPLPPPLPGRSAAKGEQRVGPSEDVLDDSSWRESISTTWSTSVFDHYHCLIEIDLHDANRCMSSGTAGRRLWANPLCL